MEQRRHLSTTVLGFDLDGHVTNGSGTYVTSSISLSHSGGTEIQVGNPPDYGSTIVDFRKGAATLTFTNLPAHTMARVLPSTWLGMNGDFDGDTDTCKVQVADHTFTATMHADYSGGGGVTTTTSGGRPDAWVATSGSTLTVTVSTEGMEDPDQQYTDDIAILSGAGLWLYEPTISASGGGSMTEAGIGGSGSATFTVSRDLPEGYNPLTDDDIPATHVSVSKGGTADPSRYKAAQGYDDLPDGDVTIDGYRVSQEYKIIPVDDAVSEPHDPPSSGQVQPQTITWEVQIPDAPTPAEEELTFTATIEDDSSATPYIAQNPFQGPKVTVLNTDVEYPTDGDPTDSRPTRDLITYEEIDDYEPIGYSNTSLNWGQAAHVSGSIGWSSTLDESLTIDSSSIPISLAIGRSQGVEVTGNFDDTLAASRNEMAKIDVYILHKKYVASSVREVQDAGGNWTLTGTGSIHVLAEGDVKGQFYYLHSMSTWKDEEAS